MGLGKLAGGASCHQSMDGAAFVSLHYERWRSPAGRRVGLNADGGAALPARPPPSSRLLDGVALVTRRIMGAFHLHRINIHYPSQPPFVVITLVLRGTGARRGKFDWREVGEG